MATNGVENGASGTDAAPSYNEAFPSLGAGTSSAPHHTSRGYAAASVRSSRATDIIRIPYEEQRYKTNSTLSLDEFRKVLSGIRKDTGANIGSSYTKDNTLSLTITGKPEQVKEARKLCLSKLQTQASIEVAIPKQYHRFLIGSKGAVRKEIEDRHACRIFIPKTDEDSTMVKVVGTAANCRAAAKEIQAISDERAKNDTVKLPIVKAYHPLIAGFDNVNVKRIMEATGVKIHIPPASANKDDITVAGEKKGVAQAVAEIKKLYNHLREHCGELTAQVPLAKHRFVIGPKGAHLREITQKTGIVVEVPDASEKSETIILRGEQSLLVHALTMVYERANSVDVVKIDVPGWLHRHIIGPGGANAKALREEMPELYIQFVTEEDKVEIEGPPSQVAVVRSKIMAMATDLQQRMSFVDVEVDPKFHGHIVGVKGANIQKIKAETDCTINMPHDNFERKIRVEGPHDGVKKAKQMILDLVKKLENQRAIDIIIPRKYHAAIIGAGGSKIKEITSKYPDLSINFPRKENDSEIISVRGEKDAVEAADAWFKKAHKNAEAEGFEMEVLIFRRYHRDIIGQNGSTIGKIRDECDVRIDIPSAEQESDIILLTGRKENCQKAKQMMEDIQAKVADIVSDTVQIPKQLHQFVIGPQGKFIRGIMDEFEVSIDLPKNASDVITVKGPSEAVPKAIAKLKELASGGEGMKIVEIKVAPAHHRYLIGRGGSMREQLEKDSGVKRVVIPGRKLRPGEEPDVVTLIGTDAACKKAQSLIEEKVKELESTITKTVDLDSNYFGDMRARRGRFLQDLQSEFGVNINLPKADEEGNVSNTVTIRGAPSAVELVIEKMKDFVDRLANSVTETHTVEAVNLPAIMGAKGVHIQRIQKDCNVMVDVPDRSKRSADQVTVDMTIKGLPDDVAAAKAEFEALTPISEEYDLDASFHRFLIGKGGEGIREFQKKHDVRLEIPKPDENKNSITIRGTGAKIEGAKAALQELQPELDDAKAKGYQMTLDVDSKFHSTLIGQKGAGVNALREKHDVRIDFPRDNKSNTITLTGYQSNCEACAADIQSKVDLYATFVTKAIELHPASHRAIVGARGANIRALQEKYGVRIIMPRDKRSPMIEVEGPEEKCDACMDELEEIHNNMEDEIAAYEDMQQYVKPEPKKTEKKKKKQAFQVRDAPWQSGDNASFPTLGGGSKPTSSMGVWGK